MRTLDIDVVVTAHGHVPADQLEYAKAKVTAALERADRSVLSARVRLTVLPDPAAQRPAIAQVVADIDGHTVRVQAARPTPREAIDETEDRLRERVERLRRDWEAQRGGSARSLHGGWRTPEAPVPPSGEAKLVRHKSFELGRTTVEEAAFDMELLDYGFQLFVEDGTGVDSVLSRDGDGYRLDQLRPQPDAVTPGEVTVSVSPLPAPDLTVAEATERLGASGEPYLFFHDCSPDRAADRGAVLYRRHDGDFGLITAE